MAKFKIPKCPNQQCKQPLKKVYETAYETYEFNPQTGQYEEGGYGDSEIRCPNCETRIEDVFPDGPCNYRAGGAKK